MTTGPATNTTRSPRAFVCRIMAAMRDTLTSTRRSDETSFDMNAKSPRSRSRNSGVTRNPWRPHTTRSPDPDFAQLPADGRAVLADDDDRVHALARHRDPAPVHAHVGPQVGGRIEVVWNRAVTVRDSQQRVPFLDGMAAEWNQLFDEPAQAGVGRGRHLQLQLREIVVGAADLEVQHLELPAPLDDGIEDGVEELRVDQVALAPGRPRRAALYRT